MTTPADWRYTLAVGTPTSALRWESSTLDAAPIDYTTGGVVGLVLDGLQTTRQLPSDQPWPCQPLPGQITFQVAAATTQVLADAIVKGQGVAWRTAQRITPGGTWQLTHWMAARITDVQIEARDNYSLATVTAVEWHTMLAEVTAGDVAAPWESNRERMERWLAQCNADAPEVPAAIVYQGATTNEQTTYLATVRALADGGAPISMLDLAAQLLDNWPVGGTDYYPTPTGTENLESTSPTDGTIGRYELAAYGASWVLGLLDGLNTAPTANYLQLLAPDQWLLTKRTSGPGTIPPASLVLTGGVYKVGWAANGGGQVPAAECELPVSWQQRIGQLPNVAVLTAWSSALAKIVTVRIKNTIATLRPRVRIKKDLLAEYSFVSASTPGGYSTQYYERQVQRVGLVLVPYYSVPPRSSWVAGAITWRPSLHEGYSDVPSKLALGNIATVTDVDTAKHPTSRYWIHGQVESVVTKITDGLPVITFALRPQLRDPLRTANPMTFGGMPAGPTFANIDPSLTIDDLRLIRS